MVPCSGLPAAGNARPGSPARDRRNCATIWVSGSLIRSSTCRSSSVSAAVHLQLDLFCRVRRTDRARWRGSFCQALPIGCIRVFHDAFPAAPAVTFDSRCSGTLNSVSSLRREISQKLIARQAPAPTPSSSSVPALSTFTRIDWLATRSPSAASTSTIGFFATGFGPFADARARFLPGAPPQARWTFGAGGGTISGVVFAEKARSSSSSDTSPGAAVRAAAPENVSVPTLAGLAAGGAAAGAGDSDAAGAGVAAMPRSTN